MYSGLQNCCCHSLSPSTVIAIHPSQSTESTVHPFSVAIVEDHPEFRHTLSQALQQSQNMQLVAVCKDLPAGMQMLEQTCPDVLLVDLGLPSGSGLALIREAQRRWGERCNSAVLTVIGNEEHLLTAVAAGAKGYLFKSDTSEDWLQAVQLLSQGLSPLHSSLARHFYRQSTSDASSNPEAPKPLPDSALALSLLQHIAAGYTCDEAAPRLGITALQAAKLVRQIYDHFFRSGPNLSSRELELLTLLNKGMSFKQCAVMMDVSESTTKTLATRAYQKLGVNNIQSALYEARVAHLLA